MSARLTTLDRIDRAMSEADLQTNVIDMAHAHSWRVAHFRTVKVQRKDGSTYHATPVQADGEGFPDLVMIRGERCIAVELKKQQGEVATEQFTWLRMFAGAHVETRIWRPSHWREGSIEEALR